MNGNGLRRQSAILQKELQKNGQLRLRGESARRLAEAAGRFVLALLLARTDLIGGCAPFAVGFAAAAPVRAAGVCAYLGAAAGYLARGDLLWSARYAATLALILAARFVCRRLPASHSVWFGPAAAGAASACTGFVYAADLGWTAAAVSLYGTEVVLAAGSAYFYQIALGPQDRSPENRTLQVISRLILAMSVLAGLSSVYLFGALSIGRAAAALAMLLIAWKRGARMGCVCGLAAGLVIDAVSTRTAFFCVVYPLAALSAGFALRRSRTAGAAVFVLVGAASAVFFRDRTLLTQLLYESFAASVLSLLSPADISTRLSALLPADAPVDGPTKGEALARERIEATAAAFRGLYETVRSAAGEDRNDSNIAALFDRAADAVCTDCPNMAACWTRDYSGTLDALNGLTPIMLARHTVGETDFPVHFRERCRHLDLLVAAVNQELRAMLYRRQYRARLRESRGAACSQYADVAEILESLAGDLRGSVTPEPALEEKLTQYLRTQGSDAACSVFRTRSGRLRAELRGGDLHTLKRDRQYLDKLSAVLGVRLCTPTVRNGAGKLTLLEAEPLAAEVGLASSRRSGESVSGDTGAYFKTEEGVLYVLLSDGMGTGASAKNSSASSARILEQFLRAGAAPESALRILNDLMLLRNETDTDSATIDLLYLDLFTGRAKIFKYGAAPSYIRTSDAVRRIRCRTPAPGFAASSGNGGAQTCTELLLPAASFVVITSDGLGTDDDGWLRLLLAEYNGTDARELAAKILRSAPDEPESDDRTVLVVRTTPRP